MTADRIDAAMDKALIVASAAGADQVEVSYVGEQTDFTRFARSRFTQVGTATTHALRVRVIAGGRLGAQMTASLDADHVATAARGAVSAARLSPELDVPFDFASAGDDAAAAGVGIPESVSASGAPGSLGRAFARHADVGFAGSMKARDATWAVRTSAGARRWFRSTDVDTQLIAIVDGASAYVGDLRAGVDAGALDLDTISDIAADKALCGRDPVALAPGDYDVVLAPAAVAELIEWMSMASFGATSVIDGTSLLAGRAGESLCDPQVTIVDRCGPHDPPFDSEGVARRSLALIDAGAAGTPVTDLYTAAKLGTDGSTGHAAHITDQFARGPATWHLQMHAGDRSEADLIGSVDRGVYVTRLHYVNGLLDTRRATTTGMTRDGAFMIEDGRLGRGVKNARFTVHLLEVLSRLEGITAERATIPAWWNDVGSLTVPGALVRGFSFVD
jgi:predicted Zn-dependent protease